MQVEVTGGAKKLGWESTEEYTQAVFGIPDVYLHYGRVPSLMNDERVGTQEVDFALLFASKALGGDGRSIKIQNYYRWHGGEKK